MSEHQIIIWEPHINQLPIARSKKKYKFLRCGRRFGKTKLIVGTLIENALEFSETDHFYIGPTYKQAKMIAWKMLMKIVSEKVPKALIHKVNESELFVEIGNHSRVHIKGQDNPDSLRGVALKSCALDEYKDFREGVFEEIIEPALLDLDGSCIIAGTPKGFNHMYRLEMRARTQPDIWDVFHYTTYDNPFMSKERVDRIKKTSEPSTFDQEYLAEYRKFEGLVYKDFEYSRHTFTDRSVLNDKVFVETIAGVDFGFTNPMASNILKRDKDNHWYVMPKHYYRRETLIRDFIEWAKGAVAEEKVERWYPDSADPGKIKEMTDAGLTVVDVNKSISAGINRIRELLRANRLHISIECKDLIREFESYAYPKVREGYNEQEDPIKQNDHALDALRYALYTTEPMAMTTNEEDSEFELYNASFN